MVIETEDVWAEDLVFGRNRVRQLLVPASRAVAVTGDEGSLQVSTNFGSWRASRAGQTVETSELTADLSALDGHDGVLTWIGERRPIPPAVVLDSFRGAMGFTRHDEPHSLRRPQIAALHSIVGYQTSGVAEPGIVVMPTGTGKTETFIAWTLVERPTKVLVIVPSSALRDQIASKFETLGILHALGIAAPSALRPCVGRVEHRFDDEEQAREFVAAANVVIATPSAIQANSPLVREALYGAFTHLIVDEAHHAPASTWTEIIRAFGERSVLLFTATPYRRDGRTIPGRIIFRFPLREAQRDGYFSTIDFTAVLDLDDDDEALATTALARLRADQQAGLDHILLARTNQKSRAEELHALYSRLGSDLQPTVLHDSLSKTKRRNALEAIRTRSSRVIVCVDMLGEGFDLPNLKVGAFHDSHKSLSPMIQLVGRLARTSSPTPVGRASVFVRQDPSSALSPLRFLLREDADWNTLLSDITERATTRAEEISEFEASFEGDPADVPVGLLEPKMSAIAFVTTATDWNPFAARLVYGDAVLDDTISASTTAEVAWFILETIDDLRWGHVPSLHPASYTLVVMYFDASSGVLYIHGSDTKRNYEPLARAVLGSEPDQVQGLNTFRVFAALDRIVPTNVGLLDARDRDKRFSMHVGSDVETALTEAERNHKTNTHIAAKAFEDGDRMTIAASLSGRFWSMRSAANLAQWREWCDQQGRKLLDTTVDLRTLFRDMIIPVDLKVRPPHPLLAMEWPWRLYLGTGTSLRVKHDSASLMLTDAELRVDDHSETGPFKFSVVTPTWEVAYEADFGPAGLHYRPTTQDDAEIHDHRDATTPLSAWLNANKPTLFLSGDRMITDGDRLLEPRTELPPYDRNLLSAITWDGVDIRVESQGTERRADSIQAFMVRHLTDSQTFDVLIDDDRAGEAADLVGLRVDGNELHITLVHCKYSTSSTPGGRLADLYEVCGQAMRGARWRDHAGSPLLGHLDRRAAAYARRTGGSAFETGDRETLFRIRERAPQLFPKMTTIIAQPGLSVAASTDEQLRLIAGAASYVQSVTKGRFEVYCSN
ncbi:DEAD/DEAH box helicase family protein [Nocardioides rotundus]|uniref:DEAD/DEAH box helicase n=1 Tax=Nocardioides rotundus TaxID=1774216 RepID=UPI001CBD31F8|nr:DEAD/DEAH box helicase family protein [Nocardioides rotundus]UAL29879.1 DEAD/DEAH box helicase family protein [Nocardioides rotundus]